MTRGWWWMVCALGLLAACSSEPVAPSSGAEGRSSEVPLSSSSGDTSTAIQQAPLPAAPETPATAGQPGGPSAPLPESALGPDADAGRSQAPAVPAANSTLGCGQPLPADDPEGPWPQGQWLERHLQTHGQKDDEDSPWSFEREFYIRIPEGYDHNRPYPIVFQGPGCGGTHPVEGTYDFDGSRDQFVMVALRPQYGIHYETCFDDKEGEDSIDWPFFESLVDYMKARTCLDENRMFAAGNSSGAWLANELGCKYAGNTEGYNIRAVGPNTGGLPPVGQEAPICSGQPLAGIWIGDLRDPSNPWEGNVLAIERALRVNGCSNPDYHAAATELFEVPDQPDICRRVLGCPPDYPVVYCTFDNGTHEFHRDFGDVAFPRFFLSL